jgi:murein DD-endopeptidase MepM/ murein hydrolase activator NlpD
MTSDGGDMRSRHQILAATRLAVVVSGVLLALFFPAVGGVPTASRAAASDVSPVAAAPGGVPVGRPALSFNWPLPGRPPTLRPFLPPPTRYSPGHRGVDLGAVIGTPVRAAAAGVVGFAGPLAGRGVMTVLHDGGLRTTYEPVIALARVGEAVSRGQQIGWLAAPTGHCGPGTSCLHWGLLRGSVYLDPLALFGVSPVRLFPRGTALRQPPVSPAAPGLPPAATPAGPDSTATAAKVVGLSPPPAKAAAATAGGDGPPARAGTFAALAVLASLGTATALLLPRR